jgi:hypothetical protein
MADKIKQNTTSWAVVMLSTDAEGHPITGVAAGSLVVYVAKNGGARAYRSIVSNEWVEIGDGCYWLLIRASDTDTLGELLLTVTTNSANIYKVWRTVVQYTEIDVYNQIGVPVGASISADIAALKSDVDTSFSGVQAKLPASVVAAKSDLPDMTPIAKTTDVASAQTAIVGLISAVDDKVARILGLVHENSYWDNIQYDGSNNMLQARVRLYDTKSNAQAAGVLGVIGTYTLMMTWQGSNMQTYSMVRES